MREIRPSGSEGGARSIPCPYPYQTLRESLGRRFRFILGVPLKMAGNQHSFELHAGANRVA